MAPRSRGTRCQRGGTSLSPRVPRLPKTTEPLGFAGLGALVAPAFTQPARERQRRRLHIRRR
jgi:hypothetical protein